MDTKIESAYAKRDDRERRRRATLRQLRAMMKGE